MPRGIAVLGGIAVAVCLHVAAPAGAATLVGDYQLQGTRASSGAGPDLTDVGGTNSFQSDSVMGVSRQVLAFPEGSGLRMSPAGLGTSPYSVVTTFRLDATSGFRKLLDSSGGIDDEGIYDYFGQADFYGTSEFKSTDPVFTQGVYATMAVVGFGLGGTQIWVNGTEVVGSDEGLPAAMDSLRFFIDDTSGMGNENSAGAVSCIRVYTGTLTAAEVSGIGASATCQVPPATPPAQTQPGVKRKKCKKHKKKHRSAEVAKKKCKKKRKR
jgi:hypothetical protein